jgi:hypothetical protein
MRGFNILILVLSLAVVSTAQSPKQHTGNKQNAQAQVDKNANNQSLPDTVKRPETQFYTYNNQNSEGQERPSKVIDYLLALFTFALVVVGYLQWKVLREHEKWMQKHDANLGKLAQSALDNVVVMRAGIKLQFESLRPRLTIGAKSSPFGDMFQGHKVLVDIEFINTGDIPAYGVEVETWLEFLDIPFTAFTPNAVHHAGAKVTIHPHKPVPFRIPFGRALDAEEIAKLKSVKATLYLRTRLTYDALGEQRCTDYTFEITPTTLNIYSEYCESS